MPCCLKPLVNRHLTFSSVFYVCTPVCPCVCVFVFPGRDASHYPRFVLSALPSSTSHLRRLWRPSLSHLWWTHAALPGIVHIHPGTGLRGRRLQVSSMITWFVYCLCPLTFSCLLQRIQFLTQLSCGTKGLKTYYGLLNMSLKTGFLQSSNRQISAFLCGVSMFPAQPILLVFIVFTSLTTTGAVKECRGLKRWLCL